MTNRTLLARSAFVPCDGWCVYRGDECLVSGLTQDEAKAMADAPRMKSQRDTLLAACREMLPYVERASEVMFPNLADNAAITEDARAAIALTEETGT